MVYGAGFIVCSLGFKVECSEFGIGDLFFRVWGAEFGVEASGGRPYNSGFRLQVSALIVS